MLCYGLPGGQDIRTLDPQWFRRKISMVSQEPTLFACSIKDNIAYGRDGSSEEVSCYNVHLSSKTSLKKCNFLCKQNINCDGVKFKSSNQ